MGDLFSSPTQRGYRPELTDLEYISDSDRESSSEGEIGEGSPTKVTLALGKAEEGTGFAEGGGLSEAAQPDASIRSNLRTVAAIEGDRECFARDCFQNEDGDWLKTGKMDD
jgi:hypothetical protein